VSPEYSFKDHDSAEGEFEPNSDYPCANARPFGTDFNAIAVSGSGVGTVSSRQIYKRRPSEMNRDIKLLLGTTFLAGLIGGVPDLSTGKSKEKGRL
jgi:hypothetical protein